MNNCLNCNTQTKRPKYCSRNCCNTHQAAKVTARWENYREEKIGSYGKCKYCDSILTRKSIYCNSECRWSFERANPRQKRSNDEIFCIWDKPLIGYSLKNLLVDRGFREMKCEICLLDTWMNKPIPLEVDHIDGNRLDNRLQNLRILCRNCHGQTSTFGVYNSARYKSKYAPLG